MTSIPVVDLGDAHAAGAMGDACERYGFFTVVGHGVDDEIVDAAWNTARRFFDLPDDDKATVAMPRPGYPYGWSPLAGETLARSLGAAAPPDLKQSFAIGPVDPPTHELVDPDESFARSANLWPAALPELRPAWERYFRRMACLAESILATMATALGLPTGHFGPLIDRHTSAMRALDYPGRTTHSSGRLGASAHTDYGTLTILLADPVEPGLQVEGPDGRWIDVLPVPGAFVVNLGDAMARWTNDRWRSTMHRVVVPERRRQSIAFFHNANWDAVIECLPTCLGPNEEPRYAPIAAGPHLMHKFRSTVNE